MIKDISIPNIQPSFGVKFEGGQLPMPNEIKDAKDLKLSEISFVSFDQFPAFSPKEEGWVDVLVTEAGEIYLEESQLDYEFDEKGVHKKESSSKLTKVENFTGEITFGAYLPLDLKGEGDDDGKDYSIVYKAVFYDGKLKSVYVEDLSSKSSKLRVNLMETINKNVIKQVKLLNNPLYRWLYLPYKAIVTFVMIVVTYVWMIPLRLFNWLCSLIIPL